MGFLRKTVVISVKWAFKYEFSHAQQIHNYIR